MNKTIATFGEQIRLLREEKTLSLREVAEQIGIDTSLLGKIERNDRQPTKEQIKLIARFFKLDEKDRQTLIETVKQIDQQLNIIRDKGRETFLKANPENFNRIIHDYSDDNKGFIQWKILLEEQTDLIQRFW